MRTCLFNHSTIFFITIKEAYQLKFVICGQVRLDKMARRYKIFEKQRADKLRITAHLLQDDVYTRICDLTTNDYVFSTDIY